MRRRWARWRSRSGSIAELEDALAKRHGHGRPYVVVIDTDPYPSTEEGGTWWEVAVPEVRHPFFRPLWRRGLFVGALAAWTGYEVVNANWIWAGIFAAAVAYLVYEWFVAFDPKNYGDEE
jgi:hypothetical protein